MKKVVFEGRGIKVGHWSDPIYSGIDVWKTRDRELCEKVYRATLKYMDYCETPGVQVVVKNVKGRDGHVWEYIDIFFRLARKEEN